MTLSKQKRIKELIVECMKDGEEKSVDEIKQYIILNGISIEGEDSTLRNALFNLKKENLCLKNVARGRYVWEEQKDTAEQNEDDTGYDFEDFITVQSSARKDAKLVISIFEDGTFALNAHLLQYFPKYMAEIKLKKDCSQLALIKDGKRLIHLGKNGRIKNYHIIQILKKKKKKFPIYYVGEWDDEEKIWIGEITVNNPNRSKQSQHKG